MNVLAIDASTTCTGYAFGGAGNTAPLGGIWELPGSDEMVFDRTLAMASQSVSSLCRLQREMGTPIDFVVIERPIFITHGGSSAHIISHLMQLTGAIRAAAKLQQAEVRLYDVHTVRKCFLGTGNGALKSKEAKAAVMRQCDLLGWRYADDNQADANALWFYAMGKLNPAFAVKSTPLFW